MKTRIDAFRAIFFLGGIALFIAGVNNSTPLMIVGIGLIVLTFAGGVFARRKQRDSKEQSSQGKQAGNQVDT